MIQQNTPVGYNSINMILLVISYSTIIIGIKIVAAPQDQGVDLTKYSGDDQVEQLRRLQ